MPLTKQYLRYVHQASFGVVCSRESNAVLLEAGQRQLVVAAPALEDVIIWDLRRRERVGEGGRGGEGGRERVGGGGEGEGEGDTVSGGR